MFSLNLNIYDMKEFMKFENMEFRPIEHNDSDLCKFTKEWKVNNIAQYYYGPILQKALATGRLESHGNNIHLVVFRMPDRNSNRIIYKCLRYPDIFAGSLLHYICSKRDFNKSLLFKNWGDFFTIIDSNLTEKYIGISSTSHLIKMNLHFDKFVHFNPSVKIFNNVQKYFDLVKKTTVMTSNITSSIDLAIKKDFKGFINLFFNGDHLDNEPLSNLYIIKDCLFIVQDLEKTIKSLESLGYSIKEAKKNQSDLLDAFLHSLDSEYTDSLYNLHYNLIRKHSIFHGSWLLPRNKFTFENIHTNIANRKF